MTDRFSLHDPAGLSFLDGRFARDATLLGTDKAAAPPRRRERLGRLASAAAVIYGVLAIVFIANPRPVAAWLDEFEPNPVVELARAGVGHVIGFSDALGIAGFSDAVRARVKAIIHRPEG